MGMGRKLFLVVLMGVNVSFVLATADTGLALKDALAQLIFGPNGQCRIQLDMAGESPVLHSNCPILGAGLAVCGNGTHDNGGVCEPDTVCGAGTHDNGGVCEPDTVCGAGTYDNGGVCGTSLPPGFTDPAAASCNGVTLETIASCYKEGGGSAIPANGIICSDANEPYMSFDCGAVGVVYFPNLALAISDVSFMGESELVSASFPMTVGIGHGAFSDCESMTWFIAPKATSIGDFAFSFCTSMTSFSFPMTVGIGKYAFSGCESMTSFIAPEATSIGERAFGFSGLTTIYIPKMLTIGQDAFRGCNSLTTVTMPPAALDEYQNQYGWPDGVTRVDP